MKSQKSFVGCAATIKLCVEAAENQPADITIDGKPCRILGKIKNGETRCFQVGDDEFKLYAVADSISTSFCRDVYTVEAGTENISLSGSCKYNPAAGNAFRFDGNDTAEATSDRKRSKKKGLAVLLICILIGGMAGFVGSSLLFKDKAPTEKDFKIDNFIVTLDTSFAELDPEDGMIAGLASDYQKISLSVEKSEANENLKDYSEKEIGEQLILSNIYPAGAKLTEIKKTDWFTLNTKMFRQAPNT